MRNASRRCLAISCASVVSLLLARGALAQTVAEVRMIVTRTPQTVETGKVIGFDRVMGVLKAAPTHAFVVAVFNVATAETVELDHSTVTLTACEKVLHGRTTSIGVQSLVLANDPPPLKDLTGSDLGPWGTINTPPSEEDKKFGVGSSAMLIPGEKARQLRFLFEAPERCIDGAAVNLFGARFPVLKHVR